MKSLLITIFILSSIHCWSDLKSDLDKLGKLSGKNYISQREDFLKKPDVAEFLKERFLEIKGKNYLVSALYLRIAGSAVIEFHKKNKPVYFSENPNENSLPHLKQPFSDLFKLGTKEVDIIDSKVFYNHHFRNAWRLFYPYSSISLFANAINKPPYKSQMKKYSENHLFFSLVCLEFERIFHNTDLLSDMERNIHIQEFGFTLFQEPLIYTKDDTSSIKINKQVISAYIDQVLTNPHIAIEIKIALTHLVFPHKLAYEALLISHPDITKDHFPSSLSEDYLMKLYEAGVKKIPNLNFWIARIYRPIYLKKITDDDTQLSKIDWEIKNDKLKKLIASTNELDNYKSFLKTTYKIKNFYQFHEQKEYSSLYTTEVKNISYRVFYTKKNTFK